MRHSFYTVLRGGAKSVAILPWDARLVVLQPAGERPPFFIVNSFPYFIDVVRLLGSERPIVSLVGEEGDLPSAASATYAIHDEAAAHVKSILKHQPHGPYMLGGCGASGIVAYEAAQQLRASGREVSLVVLFDTPNPHFMREYSALRMSVAYHLVALSQIRWHEVPAWTVDKLAALATRRLDRLGNAPRDAGSGKPRMAQLGSLQARITAARNYRPAPYTGHILLFKRHRQLRGRYADPLLGWGECARRTIEVCQLNTTGHLEIFKSELDRRLVARSLQKAFLVAAGASRAKTFKLATAATKVQQVAPFHAR